MTARLRLLLAGAVTALLLFPTSSHAKPSLQAAPASPDVPLGSGFTFQGRLDKAGVPVTASCAMSFDLWDALIGGIQIGATEAISSVTVSDGLFTVVLNGSNQFGATAFNGQARFLETTVQCPGDAAATTLPRQQLTAAPYALTALSANALQGRPVGAAAPTNGQVLAWNGSAWVPSTGTPGPQGPPGIQGPPGATGTTDWNGITNIPAGFADGVDSEGWALTGNAGASPANRLGTTDLMTMTFVMSNTPALRLVGTPGDSFQEFQPNILGGSYINRIGPDVHGAVISGGGRAFNSFAPNTIFDSYNVIGGGIDNEAGVDDGNPYNQSAAFVGGGFSNEAMSGFTVVAGGRQNTVFDSHGAVGGGQANAVAVGSDYGVIPGGFAAVTTQYGQLAHAGGQFNTVGDAQASEYLLRNVTNNTTARELYLDCNEQTNSNLDTGTPCSSGDSLTIPPGRAMVFQIQIVARTVSGAGALTTDSTAAYFSSGLLRNNGGTTTLTLGSIAEIGDAAATPALAVTITANDAEDRLVISVSSNAGGVVRWLAVIQTAEVAS